MGKHFLFTFWLMSNFQDKFDKDPYVKEHWSKKRKEMCVHCLKNYLFNADTFALVCAYMKSPRLFFY